MVEHYYGLLNSRILQGALTDKQGLAILQNGKCLQQQLVPALSRQLQRRLEVESRPAIGLSMTDKPQEHYTGLCDAFATRRASDIVNGKLNWPAMEYTADKLDKNTGQPSGKFLKLFDYLAHVMGLVANNLYPEEEEEEEAPDIIGRILEEVALSLGEGDFWAFEEEEMEETEEKPDGSTGKSRIESKFQKEGGLQQFIIDMRYMREAGGSLITDPAILSINDMIDRAVVAYCRFSKSDPRDVLMVSLLFMKLSL